MPGPAAQLIQRVKKGSTSQKYSKELRTFALTLQFYSTKAYNFVRKKLKTCLPHISTIRKWYRAIDGSPGFTKEALVALKMKVEEGQAANKTIVCGLIVDEMAIRKHLEWDGSQFSGYVDMGTGVDDDQLPIAKEAYVFYA